MKNISYNSARRNLAKTLGQVCSDQEPVAIVREGQRAVVLISMEEYQSLQETAYLLGNRRNALRLIGSVLELQTCSRSVL